MEIDHDSQIHQTFTRVQVGEVLYILLVRFRGRIVLFQEIFIHWQVVFRIGRRLELPGSLCSEVLSLHALRNGFSIDGDACSTQYLCDSGRSVSVLVLTE